MNGRSMRVAAVLVPVSLLLSAAAAVGALVNARRIEVEVETRERSACVQANDGRDELRHAMSDVLTDNLVEAARTPPDPAVIDAYRTGLLDDLEREFPDRPCR